MGPKLSAMFEVKPYYFHLKEAERQGQEEDPAPAQLLPHGAEDHLQRERVQRDVQAARGRRHTGMYGL